MNEHDLDQLLKQETEKFQMEDRKEKEFQMKLKRMMNKNFYSRMCIFLVGVILVGVILYYGSSGIFNQIFYNPSKEEKFLVSDERKHGEFAVLMQDFIQMHFPGVFSMVISGEDYEPYIKEGFGNYRIQMKLQSAFQPIHYDGQHTDVFQIQQSRLKVEEFSPYLQYYLEEFKDPSLSEEMFQGIDLSSKIEKMQEEIQKLPESAVLDSSISFDTYMTSDDIAEMIKKYPEISFQWLALKDQNMSNMINQSAGMGLSEFYQDAFTKDAQKKYAEYYTKGGQELTGNILEQKYQSQLQLLIDHPKFVKLMSTGFGEYITVENLQKRQEKAKKEWKAYGVRIFAEKQELQSFIEAYPVSYITIHDVKVSSFET